MLTELDVIAQKNCHDRCEKAMKAKIKYEDLKALEVEWMKRGALKVHENVKHQLDMFENDKKEISHRYFEGYSGALKDILKQIRDEFIK